MAFSLNTEIKPGYQKIALGGPWGSEPIGITSDHILSECERSQAARILFDVRGITGHPTTLDRFAIATVFAGKYLGLRMEKRIPACRFAVVGHENMVDAKKFEENVAVNRGLMVRTFTDQEEALIWLLSDHRDPEGTK
jgi:hypothetical protein